MPRPFGCCLLNSIWWLLGFPVLTPALTHTPAYLWLEEQLRACHFSLQQTLPPIKNHPVPNLPAGHLERRLLLDKEASRVWVKPEPPKPILLHLAVTARSHSTEDFFRNFPSEFPKYFLPR